MLPSCHFVLVWDCILLIYASEYVYRKTSFNYSLSGALSYSSLFTAEKLSPNWHRLQSENSLKSNPYTLICYYFCLKAFYSIKNNETCSLQSRVIILKEKSAFQVNVYVRPSRWHVSTLTIKKWKRTFFLKILLVSFLSCIICRIKIKLPYPTNGHFLLHMHAYFL